MSEGRLSKLKTWAAKLLRSAEQPDIAKASPIAEIKTRPLEPEQPPPATLTRSNSPATSEDSRTSTNKIGEPSRVALLDLCLGIDFGTRFTKVAAGSKALQRREVLSVGLNDKRLVASVVHRDLRGLFYPPDLVCSEPAETVSYIKMRMADPGSASFEGQHALSPLGVNEFEALGAFYVAGIMRMGRKAARVRFDLAPTRPVEWSCNVGVPVKHCDGDVIERFRRMARAAWKWSDSAPEPLNLTDLVAAYRQRQEVSDVEGNVDVAPELTATLAAFGEDPNTAAGLYALFDIGGGTVDGSVFEIIKGDRVRLRIIASEVASLGTVAVARHMAGAADADIDALERTLLFAPRAKMPILDGGTERRLQDLAFRLIAESRRKRRETLFSAALYSTSVERPRYEPRLAAHPDVPLLLSGGGAHSEWYQSHLAATGEQRPMGQYGIGKFRVHVLPPPPRDRTADHHRFVVSLGLANPKLILADYTLPSSQPKIEGLASWASTLEAPHSKDFV